MHFFFIKTDTCQLKKKCFYSCKLLNHITIILGILAKNAVKYGLNVNPYIKTSLSPGSGVVTYYLKDSGVLPYLENLGFIFN